MSKQKRKNPVLNIGSRVVKGAMSVSCGFGAFVLGTVAYNTKDPVAAALAGGLGLSSATLAKSAVMPSKKEKDEGEL